MLHFGSENVLICHEFVFYSLFFYEDAPCEAAKADLVILVDESGSVTPQDFRIIRLFLKHFVNNLDIGLDRVQIGNIFIYALITS